MKILKFGGTSVGKPERMKAVAELIQSEQEEKIVVLSALSGTTNSLLEIGLALGEGNRVLAASKTGKLEAHYREFCRDLIRTTESLRKAESVVSEHFEFLQIIQRISFNEALNKDILAQGELLSTRLFCIYLEEIQLPAVLLPALDFMVLDENEEPDIPRIKSRLNALLGQQSGRKLFLTQGYICRNVRGEVDNLKRGGSDYTASLIGAAVNASEIQIWTDIDGMHNNDPRVVEQTRPIEQLSFEEAAELAYFGAKILHPASIWPAQYFNIPVRLLNTMDPSARGTLITELPSGDGVKAIAAKDQITAVKIKSSRMLLAYGFLRRIFEVFEKYRTPIDMITTSEVAVSLTIDNLAQLDAIIRELEEFGSTEVDHNQTIVSIVGNEVASTPGILKNVFDSLQTIPLRMISYGGSRHNISILVAGHYKTRTLQLLNKGLFGLN